MEYQTIFTMKKSEKATVELAAMEGHIGPVVVKRLQGANPDIYRLLCHAQNSHVPMVYACEQQGDELFVAEEYVDGENLTAYLEKQNLRDAEKQGLALQLCDAVEFLHSLVPPVIHRDIKPSNIVVNGKGVLKLIDFDASRQYKEQRNSGDTRLLGTVEYAPPEQFGYSQTDVRSDIYSMGVVFHGIELLESRKQAEQWAKIVEKCTSFDPKNRYQSVAELKKEIEKLKDRKKIRWRKLAAIAGSVIVSAFAVTALAFGMWQKQNVETDGEVSHLTETPVPTFSPTPTLTPTVSPTPVPTPSPLPSVSPSPTATMSPTPSPTVSPTPSPSPTATVSPTPSPTATVSPDMPQIIRNMVNYVKIPDNIPDPSYNYYQAEAERTELIFSNTMAELVVTLLGGACYQFETKEWIYIPSEMIYGGPAYYGVSDEFMLGLDPGIYHFCIFRGNESGQRVRISTSVEVHSKEEKIDRPENLLTETELILYSDCSKDMAVVLYSDVQSKITGVEMWNQNAEAEPVDSSSYELVCDGKVLLIKEELLVKYLDKESITFSVILADGQSQNIKVVMEKGLPPFVSPTPTLSLTPTATLTPTLSLTPTVTPVPTMTEQMQRMFQSLPIPSEISSSPHNYYKSAAEDMALIHAYDVAGLEVTFLGGWCYQYETREYIYIPSELLEGGPTYYRIADEFVMGLKPGLYHIYVARKNETGKTRFMGRSLHIHGEEESVQEPKELLEYTTREFYSEYQRDVDFTVKCGALVRIAGLYMMDSDSENEPVDALCYEIILDGKGLLIKKEFLATHLDKDSLQFVVVFDDGRSLEIEVKLVEGLHPKVTPTITPTSPPEPTATPTPFLPKEVRNYQYYKALSVGTELLIKYGGSTPIDQMVLLHIFCENVATGEVTKVPMNEAGLYENFVKLPKTFLQELEPGEYKFNVYLSSEDGANHQSFSQNVEIYAENVTMLHTDRYAIQNRDDIYPNYTRGATAAIRGDKTCRFTGAYLEREEGWEAIDSSCYEILCDGKVIMVKKEYLMQFVEEETVRLQFTLDNSGTHYLKVYLHSELP